MQRTRNRTEKYRPRNARYDKDPIKRKAQQKIRDAVRYGHIIKPSNCEMCFALIEKNRLEGHHHNGYDRPLEVIWLCRECHAIEHSDF